MKFSICILFFSFISGSLLGQEEEIKKIRAEYKQITDWVAEEKLTKKTKLIEGDGESISLEIYYKDKQLKYVVAETSDGSHAAATTSYYLMEDGLMFIFHDFGYWQFSGMDDEGNSSTTDYVEESRCYFKDNKPIRCLQKNYNSDMTEKARNKPLDCKDCEDFLREFKAFNLD